ncbi:MAG: hypothetical protein HC903_05350 [Methylacidiphilales bacterium]|nr:hypothetical protein [Candidatus Methylacidiphilales bacterium]NJR14838.1 hypothetical protein [Calothrix sp. CSU_2_0]
MAFAFPVKVSWIAWAKIGIELGRGGVLNLVHFENWSFPRKYITVNLGV